MTVYMVICWIRNVAAARSLFALKQEAEEEAEMLNKRDKCDSYEVEEWEVK